MEVPINGAPLSTLSPTGAPMSTTVPIATTTPPPVPVVAPTVASTGQAVTTAQNASADLASKKVDVANIQNGVKNQAVSNNAVADKALTDKYAQEQKVIDQRNTDNANALKLAQINASKQPTAQDNADAVVKAAGGTVVPQGLTAGGQTSSGTQLYTDANGTQFYDSGSGSFIDMKGNAYKVPSTTSATDQVAANDQKINDLNAKQDQAFQDFSTSMQQFQNGTFPLTPGEQAQISATQGIYDQLIASQKLYNKNYEGGVTQAGIASGRNMYAPEVALGEIKGAVDEGLSKVAKIQSDAAKAISDLQTAFEDKNYKRINDLYSATKGYLKDKTDAINTMNDKITKAAETDYQHQLDQKKMDIQQKQQDITNKLESDKFTYQQKQDLVQNAQKDATMDLETKKFLETKWKDQQDIALKRQAANSGGNGGLGVPNVTMGGNGAPNKLQQANFLASLPGGANGTVGTMIKKMADYQTNPASFSTSAKQSQGNLTRGELITLAQQYDPTYSESQYATRQALQTNFASGKYSQNVNSLNTAVGHVSDILSNFSGLDNNSNTWNNATVNFFKDKFGSGAPTRAKLNIAAATSEIASTFKGTGATDEEIKALGSIDQNSSPDQVKAYVETAIQLLGSRLNALGDTYLSGMGKAKEGGFLSPSSQKALLDLSNQGLNIKVPELADSPILKVQSYRASLPPQDQTALDAYVSNHPEFKNDPQGLIDSLAQQGINLQ